MTELASAVARIAGWMRAHGAAANADNLAPGAAAETLDAVETELGFALGGALRALWSIHDGQLREGNGFIGAYDLLSARQTIGRRIERHLRFLREEASASAVPESGMTARELASDAWLRFAARDSDGLAINTESGRVFHLAHDDVPALHLLAPSLVAWATRYADDVEADAYCVEEGFGGSYLAEV